MSYTGRSLRRNHRRHQSKIRVVIGILISLLLIASLTGVAGAAYVNNALKSLPKNWNKPHAFDAPQPTRIISADGKLLARIYLQDRESIEATQMGTYVRRATVAVEDERFYQHGGVDSIGILRAALSGSGGGSTLTQQYVRQTILSNEATKMTLGRKVREAYLATQMEKRFTKDQILTMYLNTVYYGEGAYGVQIAARTYFAKNAADLTLPEAALIAGMPQLPSRTSPYDNPAAALARRNEVLDRMLVNRYITKKQYDAAVATPIKPKRLPEPANGIYAAPYFVSDVLKILKNDLHLSYAQRTGGGLTVRTSLNLTMQQQAEESVHDAIGDEGPECALTTINPKNGFVQAMVGGRDFAKNQINLANNVDSATPGRQPGSTFKAFTLATAINNGLSPNTTVNGSAVTIPTSEPGGWKVVNSEGQAFGRVSVANATYNSINGAYARIEMALGSLDTKSANDKRNVEIGAQMVSDTAKKLGVTSLPLPPNPSLTLGGDAVTVQDIASGFATFAAGGVYHRPVKIASITDRNNKVIYDWSKDPKNAPKQVLSPSVNYAVVKVLQGVAQYGTGTPGCVYSRQMAAKTGTTDDSANVWFTGFTPNFCTSVWRGWRDNNDTVYINGGMAYGGPACGPIWKDYAEKVFENLPAEDFQTAPEPTYSSSKFLFYNNGDPKKKKSTEASSTASGVPSQDGDQDSSGVPSYIGQNYQTAFDAFTQAGYTVVWIQQASSAPRGTIIAQSVNGNTVTLTVSLGGG
ncbi:MAG: penicillin-binding protein [Actinomycetia bacterium]|nr:penicillin-binding protein [Actinomycetes bacterium]